MNVIRLKSVIKMCETLSWFQAIRDVNLFLEIDFATEMSFYDKHTNNWIFKKKDFCYDSWIKLLLQSEGSF